MRRKLFLSMFIIFISALALMNCGEPTTDSTVNIPSPQTQSVTITIAVPAEGGIHVDIAPNIIFPDGLTTTNEDEYADTVQTLIGAGYQINFILADTVQTRIEKDLTDTSENPRNKAAVIYLPWSYVLSYDYTKKKVTCNCFSRDGYYVTIRLNKGSSQVFDMHATSWTENGRRCFGLYESVSWWCKSICAPSYNDILNAIYYAALAVGLSATIAWMVATIMTPIVIALLAI